MSEIRHRPANKSGAADPSAAVSTPSQSQEQPKPSSAFIQWDVVISVIMVLLGLRLLYVGLGFGRNEFDVLGWLDKVVLGIDKTAATQLKE
ncbi:hypothetical protein HDU93_000766 [Gonapodya sp. JEL0774]|nr:hypothetical protein HDU93_000766 [Gonapodya sp. JEL0774]